MTGLTHLAPQTARPTNTTTACLVNANLRDQPRPAFDPRPSRGRVTAVRPNVSMCACEALPPLMDMTPLARAPAGLGLARPGPDLGAARHTRCPLPTSAAMTALATPLGPGARSGDSGHDGRPPEARPTAFTAHPPDRPPRPALAVDSAIIGPLVRPGRPRIRFLSIGSRLGSTLPGPRLATTPPALRQSFAAIGLDGGLQERAVGHARHKKRVARFAPPPSIRKTLGDKDQVPMGT